MQPLADNPFLSPYTPAPVQVAAGGGAYRNACEALRALDLSAARGKRVLLKPNTGRVAPAGSGIVTDPGVVAAAIDVFREAGAVVAVGESPIAGVMTMEAFTTCGITALAAERDCPLVDLDERPFISVEIPDGVALRSIKLCADIPEFDLVVSIPVMKMHMHTGVTLSIKNMKGCLWRRSKVDLHMLPPVPSCDEKPIDIAIADLATVLTPHLALIDGTVGMEGLGPSAGRPRALNVVVASADAFAADAVACALMGIDAADISHLRLGAARLERDLDLGRLDIRPDRWRCWRQVFAPPPSDLAVVFPGVNVLDRNSCSACQSTLLLFLKRYGAQVFECFPPGTRVSFAIGKGNKTVPAGTVCVGNCTARHREQGVFVPGCPPVASEILGAISGRPAVDIRDGKGDSRML
ncbi:MAG: DUF362 domain-containing protein [Phycisphaerae bacterium]|nr:DUF362 domain-containing protein [Phycisphaerae bacterium]